MSDMTRDLLIRGVSSAQSGDRAEAFSYFERMLRLDPSIEEKKEAWYWMSMVSETPAEKRKWLEELLAYDLWDSRARREMAILDGKLKPDEIIDPNQPQRKKGTGSLEGKAQRFTCPKCGGRMTYSPDGQSLICEYCESRQRIEHSGPGVKRKQEGDDFIIGLATAKGHLISAHLHSIKCQGCGATFLIQPGQLTRACPYCQSDYVLDQTSEIETISPNGLIPFQFNADQAKQAIRIWFENQQINPRPRVTRGQAIYLPAWVFDIGGQISYHYQTPNNRQEWVDRENTDALMQSDMVVPATTHLPEDVLQIFHTYDLDKVLPFDEAFLANWIAENYQVSMADASLDARKQAYTLAKERILPTIEGRTRNLSFTSAGMQVETYRLLLLPVWITRYLIGDRSFVLLINGQTGFVCAENPSGKARI